MSTAIAASLGHIVAVRTERLTTTRGNAGKPAGTGLYRVPAKLIRVENGQALVRFAAGNERFVNVDLIETASHAETLEFLDARST